MMPALLAMIWGFVLGLGSGGNARALARFELRYWPGILALFVVQSVLRGRAFGLEASSWGLLAWSVASLVLVVLVARIVAASGPKLAVGLGIIGVGTLMNLLVVLLNGGMPVASSHPGLAIALSSSGGFYVHEGQGTLLAWMGDVVELGLAGRVLILSPGDVLLLVGVAVVIIEAMSSAPNESSSLQEELHRRPNKL